MDNVSRPLIALLVGSVAFFALWIVALKPSATSRGSQGGLRGYQSAIAAAHKAVAVSGRASVAHGGTVVTTTPRAAAAPAVAPAAHPAAPSSVRHALVTATSRRLNVVTRALARDKVLALLFYNPAGADDRAVKRELAAVPGHHGRVVRLAVPISELSRYPVVTAQVPVIQSPTLVLIDARHEATTILGFADRFEIAVRVDDALAVR